MKNEILTIKNLNSIGFDIQDGHLVSVYTPETCKVILDDIVNIVKDSKITTRKNRGLLKDTLLQHDSSLRNIVKTFSKEQMKGKVQLNNSLETSSNKNARKTPRQNTKYDLFGGNLCLKSGRVNDLYRAIDKIYSANYTDDAILPLIGLSLRLLLEIAAREHFEIKNGRAITKQDKDAYNNFMAEVKQTIAQKNLNFCPLSSNFLESSNIEGLLHKYAHGEILYDRSNIIQTSYVVADIINQFFGK